MRKKRVFRAAAAAVMILALLLTAGCGGGAKEADEPAVEAFKEEPGNTPVTEGKSETEDEEDETEDTDGESWAIYWYLCGSDLETNSGFASKDLAEMQNVVLPDNVTVVIQTGGALAWHNDYIDPSAMTRLAYTSDGLFLLETSEPVNMGDPDTFEDFLDFCEEEYPADRKVLVLWDHGGGSGSGICVDEQFDKDLLTLAELQMAFASSYGAPGDEAPFELIGFDACLMATVDVAALCAGYARYMTASEETEPACGWKYDGWIGALADDTGMDGAELGRSICDSYYEGCEYEGQEGEATLSTIDLSKIDRVVAALDTLSLEGIATALSGSPAAFFADYGRGATKAEIYGDGGYGMVDLVSLASENSHLFPQTVDELLDSVSDCVVYQRTGPYRAQSYGLSAYFPYTMDAEECQMFGSGAASQVMLYMYELLLTGGFSEEAIAYFAQAEDFEDSLLEEDYEFTDVSVYGLEDHPVDVIEEDGITYAVMDLGADAAESLRWVTFMLAAYSDDGEEVIVLGEKHDLESDWESGMFTDSFYGVWGTIDGHPVMMSVSSVTDDYILYDIPILLNGELCSLSVSYLQSDGTYNILTATPEDEEGYPSKQQYLLMPGDEVTVLMYYLGGDQGLYESETFVITEDTEFYESELPDGAYGFLYVMTDYAGNTYMSEVVGVSIEDGFPVMFALE